MDSSDITEDDFIRTGIPTLIGRVRDLCGVGRRGPILDGL